MGITWNRPLWQDRAQAGALLSQKLAAWKHADRTLVLGLPRGGVVVAAAVAEHLHLPLYSWSVRKIAHPANPEYALGAIASGGVLIWDDDARILGAELRQRLISEQERELQRRQALYGDPPIETLQHHTLIVVDDGVATGLTIRAALHSIRKASPDRLVLAVPVIDQRIARQLRPSVSALIALAEVDDLWSVGVWYHSFHAVEDQQVIDLLTAAHAVNRGQCDVDDLHTLPQENNTVSRLHHKRS